MRKVFYIMGILDDSDTEWLATNGTAEFLPAGTVLVEEGSPIDSVYIVLDGQLSVVSQRLNREIASLSCGEMLGEISFVDSRLPAASVVVERESYVLAVKSETLTRKLADDSAFAARFYRAVATLLADRLRSTVGQLGYDVQKKAPEADDLDDEWMENISYAASRFDQLLKKFGLGQPAA
jgi:CRP/FNR family transcriptional regulator, cyclic AMP receptor protein